MWPLPSSLHTHSHLAFLRSTTNLWSNTALLASQSRLLPHHFSSCTDFLDRLTILPTDTDRWDGFSRYLLCSSGRWRADRDGGSRLLLCPQSEIVDNVRMNPPGRERTQAGCIWFPPRFLNFFLCKPEPITRSRFHRHEACSPFRSSSSQGRLLTLPHRKSSFRRYIASATDSLGNYSQMTSVSVSSTCPEGCAEEGRIKAV